MAFKHDELHTNNRGWLRLVAIVSIVLAIFLGASFIAVNSWYNDNLNPVATTEEAEEVVVVIQSGSSVRDIADQLKDLGLIRNATVFTWYVARDDARSDLQAGTYRISSDQSVESIVDQIVAGDVATNLFTILPGQRLDQLEEDLVEFGFTSTEVATAFNALYDNSIFASTPPSATLEGYIFPETYEITIEGSVEQLLNRAFIEFESRLSPELLAALEAQGLTFHQAVILSSIIYLEGGSPEDQRQIAQVFLKRLDEGISLGSDPTFRYAAAVTGQEATVDIDSPYNTRIYAGLPPGPISNFNLSAMEALANPAPGDFLFFVAGDDGNTYFSRTQAEHQANVDRYCIELCKL